jgi:hypothetical protein
MEDNTFFPIQQTDWDLIFDPSKPHTFNKPANCTEEYSAGWYKYHDGSVVFLRHLEGGMIHAYFWQKDPRPKWQLIMNFPDWSKKHD